VEEVEERGAVQGEREGDAGDAGETGHVPCELGKLARGVDDSSGMQDEDSKTGQERRLDREGMGRSTHLRLIDQSLFVENVDLLCRLDMLGRHESAADQHGAARTRRNRLILGDQVRPTHRR
jgi:hypothetical protein